MPDLAFSGAGNVTVPWTAQQLQADVAAYTFTATSASPCVFTPTPPGLLNGAVVQLSGTTVPTGFTAYTAYYVVTAAQATFQLAATPGGSAINSTSTGTGTVTQVAPSPGYV